MRGPSEFPFAQTRSVSYSLTLYRHKEFIARTTTSGNDCNSRKCRCGPSRRWPNVLELEHDIALAVVWRALSLGRRDRRSGPRSSAELRCAELRSDLRQCECVAVMFAGK